jgi:hypothetical protein
MKIFGGNQLDHQGESVKYFVSKATLLPARFPLGNINFNTIPVQTFPMTIFAVFRRV